MRTRFAPSPTGYMHIGNLRTALYEYLIAKSNGGKFILRIEDTDQERYVEGAMDAIFNTLEMTGIKYDEGPYVGGDYGPYIQSERLHLYKKYAQELVDKGEAYYCFCTKERLDSLKKSAAELGDALNYDRHCFYLDKEEVEKNLRNNVPHVIRQKMPTEGTTTFHDVVYGDITIENKTLEDQVLLKSDGYIQHTTLQIVDDHLMKITHVVRGNEYLSSTPKYNLLYSAFGWEIPTYIHLPPVMKDQHTKLSKRHGDASFQDLVERGYLPKAILNYIALLGWSPKDTEEIFTLEELEKSFNLDGLSKSPAIFDIEKLTWMNGEHIRRMDLDEFYDVARPYIEKGTNSSLTEEQMKKIAGLIQKRTEVLTEIPGKISFFAELPDYDIQIYVHKKMKTDLENSLTYLKEGFDYLKEAQDFTSNSLYEGIKELAAKLGCKNSQILWPMRTALSGVEVSPGGATEIAEILGKEESLKRMEYGISKLGG